MLSTTRYEFGDVALVEFPFTDLSRIKKRPAVIVSRKAYHAHRPDVIVMGVTSHIRQPLSTGEALLEDWRSAGLLKPSMPKPLLATVEKSIVERILESLSSSDIGRLKSAIREILEC